MVFNKNVNCWFCNVESNVSFFKRNSWTCSHCSQYNGFKRVIIKLTLIFLQTKSILSTRMVIIIDQ